VCAFYGCRGECENFSRVLTDTFESPCGRRVFADRCRRVSFPEVSDGACCVIKYRYTDVSVETALLDEIPTDDE